MTAMAGSAGAGAGTGVGGGVGVVRVAGRCWWDAKRRGKRVKARFLCGGVEARGAFSSDLLLSSTELRSEVVWSEGVSVRPPGEDRLWRRKVMGAKERLSSCECCQERASGCVSRGGVVV